MGCRALQDGVLYCLAQPCLGGWAPSHRGRRIGQTQILNCKCLRSSIGIMWATPRYHVLAVPVSFANGAG
jgi:hypothetical protein